MPAIASKPNVTTPPTVVVLSADETVRDAIGHWFNELSITTLTTGDGREANAALKTHAAGLLIVDRMMPPWPGLDTFLQLKSVNPSLRIAYVDDGSWDGAILARVAGASVVLEKPLKRQHVVAALGRPEILK